MYKKKLYNLLPEGFELPNYINFDNKVIPLDAGNTPFMYWPDGIPCIEANHYMIVLLHKGFSRRNRGGTLATYAKNISSLIRFCHQNNWNFTDLDNNSFTIFINGLLARNALGQLVRTSNQVLVIGRACIDFFRVVQYLHGMNSFIGEKGCAITVEEHEFKISLGNGKFKTRWVWSHDSFPSQSPKRTNHPISNEVVDKLKTEGGRIADKSRKARTELMIACFEQTGGRRGEVADIRVKDIKEANQQKGSAPMLKILTLKKGKLKESYRLVPVPRAFLQQAMKYIQRHRRRVIRNTIGFGKDHGFLLISHTKGTRLTDDTLTTQVSNLANAAGVGNFPSHWHLFRHAYITQKLKAIILQHNIANKDQFRKSLLNTEAFKQQLQQWTGHSDLSSLDPYIDLAFAELSNMAKSYSAVNLGAAVGLVKDRLNSLKADIKAGNTTSSELMTELEELINGFQEDIEAARDSGHSQDKTTAQR